MVVCEVLKFALKLSLPGGYPSRYPWLLGSFGGKFISQKVNIV